MFDLRPRLHPVTFLTAFALTFITIRGFSPGAMTSDSLGQLSQAVHNVYIDLHPPIMAALWHLGLQIWPHIGVLFIFQAIVYWTLWCLLAILFFSDVGKQLLVLGVACLPPLWCQVMMMWKDTELSIALLGCFICVLLEVRIRKAGPPWGPRLRWVIGGAGLVFFFYSSCVRENSLPALLPLAYLALRTFKSAWPRLRSALGAVLFCAGGLLSAHIFDYGILHTTRCHIFQQIQAFDIVGVFSQDRDQRILPSYWKAMNPQMTDDDLARSYDPTGAVPLFYWKDHPLHETVDQEDLDELTRKWLWMIVHHPVDYLRHRLWVFHVLMQARNTPTYFPYYFRIEDNGWGAHFDGDDGIRNGLISYFSFFRNTFFFRGWAYLIFLTLFLALRWKRSTPESFLDDPAHCAALAGLLYLLGFFVYVPGGDFRYLYPTVVMTFLSILIVFSGIRGKNENLKEKRPTGFKTHPRHRRH